MLVDRVMDYIDKEWNNPGESEKRMRYIMNVRFPYNISHSKTWIDNYDETDIMKWEEIEKKENVVNALEDERKLHYIELNDIIREGEDIKIEYYEKLRRESKEDYDKRKRGRDKIVECYMGNMGDVIESDKVDVAYIDSCAGEHIWRTDTGHKYLREVSKQEGKCVRGITGDRVKLGESGMHDILGKVYMGDVVCNLISLPNLLDKGYTMKGEKDSCEISDKLGRIVIRGYRKKGDMYQCKLKASEEEITVMMSNAVIHTNGLVQDKHLSGEEIARAKKARKLHRCLHITYKALKIGLENGCYIDNMSLTGEDVSNAETLFGRCLACAEGCMKAPRSPQSESKPSAKIGSRLAMDLHPMKHTTLGGSNWILYAVDEKSGYVMMCGMKDKTTTSVEKAVLSIVSEVNGYGHKVDQILFDNEATFNSVADYVRRMSIEPLSTPTGLHNRLIERYTQTISNKARALEADVSFVMPNYLRGETLFAAKDSINKSIGFKSGKYHTPYELMIGRKPSLPMHKYGSTGMAFTPRQDRPDDRSEWCVFMSEKSNGNYRVYIPARRDIYSVRRFDVAEAYPLSWGWKRRSTLIEGGMIYGNEDALVETDIFKKEEVRELIIDDKLKESSVNTSTDTSEIVNERTGIEEKVIDKTGREEDSFVEQIFEDTILTRTRYPRRANKQDVDYSPVKIASRVDQNSKDVRGNEAVVMGLMAKKGSLETMTGGTTLEEQERFTELYGSQRIDDRERYIPSLPDDGLRMDREDYYDGAIEMVKKSLERDCFRDCISVYHTTLLKALRSDTDVKREAARLSAAKEVRNIVENKTVRPIKYAEMNSQQKGNM